MSSYGSFLQEKFVQLHFLKKVEGFVANFLVFNRADILAVMWLVGRYSVRSLVLKSDIDAGRWIKT